VIAVFAVSIRMKKYIFNNHEIEDGINNSFLYIFWFNCGSYFFTHFATTQE
jgi:hypothetical protein